ncbi:non-specific lipid-transfer protein-like protein [Senna tora]|uniref:Non-specific lipid-transfer protein-like protein n=1 Tax=Senna tora TaxID=362788 RepID=A0A834SMR4_9FABA|nr:non-specific lipid-transfer protein-like protein [Senna tora]
MGAMMGGPARAQISTPCNASMINVFTPCMNYLTNSSSNGATSSPTSQCCDSLKSLTAGGMDCLCLLVTASVPFKVPINRTLAISLPRACQMPGVPAQAHHFLRQFLTRNSSSSFFYAASSILPSPTTPSLAPESDTTTLSTPPSSSVDTDTPSSSSSGGRSDLTPSSSSSSHSLSPSLLKIIALGLVLLKFY